MAIAVSWIGECPAWSPAVWCPLVDWLVNWLSFNSQLLPGIRVKDVLSYVLQDRLWELFFWIFERCKPWWELFQRTKYCWLFSPAWSLWCNAALKGNFNRMPPLLPTSLIFIKCVGVSHLWDSLSMSSAVTGGKGQIQLTSFRKEAKKGSAKAAVLIVKDTYSQCQAQCTNHSVLPQFWTSKAHLVFTLKDKAPSVNFPV